ncbi:MAG: DNA-binding cell septation regulator SpoVG [Candidatus Omnitrophota bacterium]|jgi:DNA-binding cell septation regulator SpoVG
MTELTDCRVVSLRHVENQGKLRAIADLRIGASLIIKNCPVFEGKNGRFASFPRISNADGQWQATIEEADDSLKKLYMDSILKAYEEEALQQN